MTRRSLAIAGLGGIALIAVAAVTAFGSPGSDSSDVATDRMRDLMGAQSDALESGLPSPGNETKPSVSMVIGPDGEAIECSGRQLIVEDRGAEPPVAYLEGAEDQAVAMPSDPIPDDSGIARSFAPRCGSDGSVYWKQYG